MKKLISIRLDSELLKKIDRLAEESVRTRSNMIEILISKAIKIRENNQKENEHYNLLVKHYKK